MSDLPRRLRLIVITDREMAAPRTILDVVDAALSAGAPAIQLRSKASSGRDILALAVQLRARTSAAGALLFLNDRVDLALAADADGVHVGPDDLPLHAVRAVAGAKLLVGASASTPGEADSAVRQGANYIGCGSVFHTSSKADAGDPIGVDGLARVVASVEAPVVGIGGVTEGRAPLVQASGAAGCAVIGAVMSAPDIGQAVTNLLKPWG